jgi:hypothetical protein
MEREGILNLFLHKRGPAVTLSLLFHHSQAIDKVYCNPVLPEDGAHIEQAERHGPEAVGRIIIDVRIDQEGP